MAEDSHLPDLWPGEFVVTPRGVGLLYRVWQHVCVHEELGLPGVMVSRTRPWASVQFGAAGPFTRYPASSVRPATAREVEEAGMHGVGGRVR